MTRLYARCAGGQRIHESTPDGRWKILTILGAISTRGMIANLTSRIRSKEERLSWRTEMRDANLSSCLEQKVYP
jgi:hypothetical protein